MSRSHHRQFVPRLEVSHGSGTRSPHFVRVVHTTGGRPQFLTINNSRITVLHMLVTERQPQLTFGSRRTNTWRNDQYLNSNYVAVLHQKTTELQPYVHRGSHLTGYPSQKLTRACMKSSVHSHGTEVRGGNFKWFKTSIGRFATDSQGHTRTSDGDLRTGTFHQTRVTVGDTSCRVKGV